MAYREFIDETGSTWKVWDVKPQARYVPEQQNELHTTNPDGLRHVSPDWRSGWLAFQSEQSSRRLRGIPGGWETTGEFKLRDYLKHAAAVRQRNSE